MIIITLTLSDGVLPGLERALEELGFEARQRPLLRLVERPSMPLAELLNRPVRFGGIAVTSPRGASLLGRAITGLDPAARGLLPVIWAAGPSTRAALPLSVESRAPESGIGAEALAKAMVSAGVRGPVLYPCAAERRDELPSHLNAAGIQTVEVIVYEVELAGISAVREAMQDTDLVLIASHRVLQAASQLVGRPGLICLGPATARTATALGWRPVAVAEAPTVYGVIDALHSLLFAAPGPQSSPSNPSSGR